GYSQYGGGYQGQQGYSQYQPQQAASQYDSRYPGQQSTSPYGSGYQRQPGTAASQYAGDLQEQKGQISASQKKKKTRSSGSDSLSEDMSLKKLFQNLLGGSKTE
ncbi:MAG: hypothetical protein LUG93_11515, partial [Lachnospiraceae bacterium]|nr:hypothetical protein [Lachnospiraceae bacterium]